jgi:hypothetical protein
MYEELAALGTPMTHNFAVGPGSEDLTAAMNKGVTPIFTTTNVQDPKRTAEEGRPIFVEQTIALLHVAGDPYNTTPMELSVAMERFPVHYEKWRLKKQERHISGTPLREWPLLSSHEVAEFEALNIFNVEGLSGISDANINRHPSLRSWREKAQAFLEHAKDSAVVTKYADENRRLRADVEDLKAQVEKLAVMAETAQKKARVNG